MAYDHRTAYHDLVTCANPYDTLVYSRYPDSVAEAQRAYDAACELTLAELDELERDEADLRLFERTQPNCIDFQWKIIAAQERAVRAAQAAEAQALAQLEDARRAWRES